MCVFLQVKGHIARFTFTDLCVCAGQVRIGVHVKVKGSIAKLTFAHPGVCVSAGNEVVHEVHCGYREL